TRIIVHGAIRAKQSAMPVTRVFTKTNVANHEEVWGGVLQAADRILDDAVFRPRAAALLVLCLGKPEEEDRRDRKGVQRLRLGPQGVNAQPVLSGHREDGLAATQVRFYEYRIDEMCRREFCFADESAHR